MNKYTAGKIYKIVNNTNENIYVGSTINVLSTRFQGHKNKYNRQINGKDNTNIDLYNAFNEIGVNNFRIILIENYACNSKMELTQREDYYIQLLKPQYNKRRAYTTDAERKQYKRDIGIVYRNANKERVEKRKAAYRELNKHNHRCEACDYSTYQPSNLARHLQSKTHRLEQMEYDFDIEMDRLGNDITLFD